MCAIAGTDSRREVEMMLSVMKHRAPDGEGIVECDGFYVGMGRLKILDLVSPGLCPVTDGDMVMAYNGELYNYLELREELKHLGYEFHTESDSEVVLKAYRAWGPQCLEKFNWMGAIAIYKGRHIFLARDLAGEKPLYYRKKPFAFASERKAISGRPIEFPPAHYGIFNIDTGHLSLHRWWFPDLEPRELDLHAAVRELDDLLQSAVSLRTRAHVPYGLYFSGGIDSTLISTYHDFKYKYTYKPKDYRIEFNRVLPKILWHLDGPTTHFSPFGYWKLAEEAHKEVKVVLSGEGADELFGGYVRYIGNEFNRRAQKAFPSYKGMFPYTDMMWGEFNGNLRTLLRIGDRMASAWGIENRCPFLDRRIIEFALRLPIEHKIQEFETKIVLRELIKKRLPSYHIQEKEGFYVKVNEWIGSKDGFGKNDYMNLQKEICKKFSSPEAAVSSGTTSPVS